MIFLLSLHPYEGHENLKFIDETYATDKAPYEVKLEEMNVFFQLFIFYRFTTS